MENTATKLKTSIASETIYEIKRSETEVIRISYCKPEGRKAFIDQRVYFLDAKTGEFRPTKKGFTVNPGLVEELAKGYLEADEFIQKKS